jgi:prevent-host-death family protein
MRVPLYEAKNRLSALLDQVERGAEITITRHGIPVAKLVPAAPTIDREKSRRAAQGLRATSRTATLGGIPLKTLIDEGRA